MSAASRRRRTAFCRTFCVRGCHGGLLRNRAVSVHTINTRPVEMDPHLDVPRNHMFLPPPPSKQAAVATPRACGATRNSPRRRSSRPASSRNRRFPRATQRECRFSTDFQTSQAAFLATVSRWRGYRETRGLQTRSVSAVLRAGMPTLGVSAVSNHRWTAFCCIPGMHTRRAVFVRRWSCICTVSAVKIGPVEFWDPNTYLELRQNGPQRISPESRRSRAPYPSVARPPRRVWPKFAMK